MYNNRMNVHAKLLAPLLPALVFIVFITLIGPTRVIALLGVEGGYLAVFIASALGGFSLIASGPLIITIAALAAAGLHPFLLGLVAGIGMTIGDSLYLWIGRNGAKALPEGKMKQRVDTLSKWISGKPRWMVPFVVYVYVGFTPLPNEAVLLSASALGGKLRYVLLSLLLGNITLATAIALFGAQLS